MMKQICCAQLRATVALTYASSFWEAFFSCIAGRVRDIVGQQRDENENEIKIP